MEMRAYPFDYLAMAQRVMGDMLDFAVNTCEMDLEHFYGLFLMSDIARQFQEGNPTYIAGKTGCELAKEVVIEAGLSPIMYEDEMYLDKSPEYWTGWSLAYYQWYTCRSFIRINDAAPISKIIDMYEVYHEMDIIHFVNAVNGFWEEHYKDTNLKRIRKYAGLSQKKLSELSGVPVRQIQLFEQRQRDINHTRAIDIVSLGRVLGCKAEELLQI